MVKHSLGITFSDAGIGGTLNQYDLRVPLNQRSYAWEASHVTTLFEDFSAAIQSDSPGYFLGTIVLTQAPDGAVEVADGQQRLATTTILIAAIRDYLHGGSGTEKGAATKYSQSYLLEFDETTGENAPKLRLNSDDNDFFVKHILLAPDDPARQATEASKSSHARLQEAAREAAAHVKKIVAPYNKQEGAKRLYEWIKFLRDSAIVIVIRVPDHVNAYTLFETLNDRGLKASQADILKNFVFGKSQDRLGEISHKWSAMAATIDAISDDDLLLTFLRHHWISQNGPTTEKELAARFKEKITSRQGAVDTVISMEKSSLDYSGLLSPLEHMGWQAFDKETRGYLYVLTRVLGIEQIRPLLLAVIWNFSPQEAKKAFRSFVSWSVRFLVAGGGGGGVLDRHYGLRAKEITGEGLASAKDLNERMKTIVRSNDEFRQAFATHRVSKNVLARYYIRSLELAKQSIDPNPLLGGTLENTISFNLEHVLPVNPGQEWAFSPEIAHAYSKRLGNMALLNPSTNVDLANKGFNKKRLIYQHDNQLLTKMIGQADQWGPTEIDARQLEMADLALQVWAV